MSFQSEFAQRNNKPRPVTIAGYPCLVRRPAVRVWLSLGLIPQSMAEAAAAFAPKLKNGDANAVLDEMDAAQVAEIGLKWQQLLVTLCVTGDDGTQFSFGDEPGKVNVYDLDNAAAFIDEAIAAVMGSPIATADGEVSADALTPFRGDGDGAQEPAGAGAHGEDVQLPPVRTHRHPRRGSGT